MSAETIFTIFCLECYKQYRHLTGKTVSKLFKDYGVYGYLNEFYDVLIQRVAAISITTLISF